MSNWINLQDIQTSAELTNEEMNFSIGFWKKRGVIEINDGKVRLKEKSQ